MVVGREDEETSKRVRVVKNPVLASLGYILSDRIRGLKPMKDKTRIFLIDVAKKSTPP